MPQTIIAVICDCDDTLAPDTTEQLLAACGIDPRQFFDNEARRLVDQGWDPSIAYLQGMLELAKQGGPLHTLTQLRMKEIGRKLKFFPGVPQIFKKLRTKIEDNPKYRQHGLRLEVYVVTGGIEELISAKLRPTGQIGQDPVDWIWGCNFAYLGSNGPIQAIKNIVSFTEKTKFLFCIQKGLVGSRFANRPYDVNRPMDADERRVPFRNMIYLGDGPSDIPCMSLLSKDRKDRGSVIGIINKSRPRRTWELGYGRRVDVTVDPDFREKQSGYNQLLEATHRIADRIVEDIEYEGRRTVAPSF
jgi:hypothetical protein